MKKGGEEKKKKKNRRINAHCHKHWEVTEAEGKRTRTHPSHECRPNTARVGFSALPIQLDAHFESWEERTSETI